MSVRKIAYVFCAAAVLFLIALFIFHFLTPHMVAPLDGYRHATVSLGSTVVDAQIADTPPLQALGLGKRSDLPEGKGMLFVFNDDSEHLFWMKDMEFPIDILWLSSDLRVVHIEPDVAPATYPKTFGPSAASRYVLEVPANFAHNHGVAVGQYASVSY